MSANGAFTLTIPSTIRPLIKGSLALALALVLQPAFAAEEECDYGPPNLIKTIKTPFSATNSSETDAETSAPDDLGSISLSSTKTNDQQARHVAPSVIQKMSIKGRIAGSRMYLPERMIIGQTSKFTVKAKPGMYVAIAMADRDKGAKPIAGHELRLGADRKVVAIMKVPETGVAEIYVEAPIEGDLIGQPLFFEAALWSKSDLSDVEWAQTMTAAASGGAANAVMMAAPLTAKKRGVNIVPDGAMPMSVRQQSGTSSLSSGQP